MEPILFALTFLNPVLATYCQSEEVETGLLVKNPLDVKKIEYSVGAFDLEFLLMSSTMIIDKSLLIKKLLETDFRVAILTYPDGWGKTINMDMLKTFLKLEVSELGAPTAYHKRENVRLFKEGEKYSKGELDIRLNKPFLIGQHERFCDTHLGNSPVISVPLYGFSERSYDNVMCEMKDKIGEAFKDHEYMSYIYSKILDNDKTPEAVKDDAKYKLNKFERYKNGDVNIVELQNSLRFLSDILFEHYKKPAYVFIDDYDDPFRHILTTPMINAEELNNFVDFFSTLMAQTFHPASHVKRGFITGVLKVATEKWLTPLRKYVDYNILNDKLHEFFGFQHHEVESMFTLASVPTKTRQKAYDYYNGYGPGPNETDRLYNCISITNFLLRKYKTGRFLNTDPMSSYLPRFFESEEFTDSIMKLLKGDDIEKSESILGNLTFTKEQFANLKNFISFNRKMEPGDLLKYAYKILFTYGYLTLSHSTGKGAAYMVRAERDTCSSASNEETLLLRLPNKEMSNEVKKYFDSLVLGIDEVDRITDPPADDE